MQESPLRKGQVLVVGLGNPGSSYETTRHNMGHSTICAYAKERDWTLKKSDRLNGRIASGMVNGIKVYLLMPSTYVNNSGLSVRKSIEFFKIPLENVLVIADDINIPFGKFRFREKGGDGGHNGLKSIEAHIHTSDYCRLRIGIGNTFIENLEEFVLSNFSEEELGAMPRIFREADAVIDTWIKGETQHAKELATKAQCSITQGEKE